MLRGLLFGLPGMGYVAAGPLLGRPSAGLVLTLALVACWPLSQGLAALAYSRPEPGAARSVLRYGVLVGTTAMAIVCTVFGALFGADPAVVAVACAQSLYLLAATAALVTGGEIWLLAALLPGLSVSFAGPPWQLVAIGWTVTGLGILVLAYERTRGGTGTGVPWTGLRIAMPYALFGLLAGGLLTFTIVAAYTGYGEPPPATSIAMVALSVAMGPAEWVLYGFRARGHDLLQESHSLREFGWRIRVTLLELVVRFLAVLALLLGLALRATEASRGSLQVAACSLLLGGALFVALMLQSCGRATASLICCAAALALETAVLALAAPPPAAVQLAGAAVLFTVLLAYALVVLGRATAHR